MNQQSASFQSAQTGDNTVQVSGNGQGYDGKVYEHRSGEITCGDGTNIVDRIVVQGSQANLVRSACQNIKAQAISAGEITYWNQGADTDHEFVIYKQAIYEYSSSPSSMSAALAVCSTPSVTFVVRSVSYMYSGELYSTNKSPAIGILQRAGMYFSGTVTDSVTTYVVMLDVTRGWLVYHQLPSGGADGISVNCVVSQ